MDFAFIAKMKYYVLSVVAFNKHLINFDMFIRNYSCGSAATVPLL